MKNAAGDCGEIFTDIFPPPVLGQKETFSSALLLGSYWRVPDSSFVSTRQNFTGGLIQDISRHSIPSTFQAQLPSVALAYFTGLLLGENV